MNRERHPAVPPDQQRRKTDVADPTHCPQRRIEDLHDERLQDAFNILHARAAANQAWTEKAAERARVGRAKAATAHARIALAKQHLDRLPKKQSAKAKMHLVKKHA